MSAPFLVSTTLCGAEGVGTIGEALRSIAPHVDAVIVVVTVREREALDIVAAVGRGIDGISPMPEIKICAWPWQNDFGAARNAALTFAWEVGADWAITVDSDETIANADEIRPFLEAQPADVLAAMMAHESGAYWQPRAIRIVREGKWCDRKARWEGRVHEAIGLSGPRFPRARFCDRPKSPDQMRAKRERDARALFAMTCAAPTEPRWHYYLGDAHAGLGMPVIAFESFERCASLPGWDEQAAWAAYRAAEILTSVLGDHDGAVEMCARGLARHAGIAELAWMAALASYRAGRFEQALHWSKLADVHGAPGLGGDGRALRSRVLFREPKGLTFGPAEVREHALRALGEHQAAERAANLRRLRLGDVESLSGVVDVGPESEEP